MTQPINIIPYLTIRDAAKAVEFYKAAFGFVEISRMAMPGSGKLMHCELRLENWALMLSDEFPEMGTTNCKSPATLGGSTVTVHISCPDVDALVARAVAAGAKPVMPVMDMFWGDRFGKVIDPFGHHWSLSTHKEDVAPDEMKRRAEEFFSKWKP